MIKRHDPNLTKLLQSTAGSYLLGSLDDAQARGLYQGMALLHDDVESDVQDMTAALSRLTVPEKTAGSRLLVTVTRDQADAARRATIFYDGSYSFNGEVVYDQSRPLGFWRIVMPAGFTVFRVSGKPTGGRHLLRSIDLDQDGNALHLYEDPFDIFDVKVAAASGEESVSFFVFGDADSDLAYTQYGCVVGLRDRASVNAAYDTLLRGSNALNTRQVVGILTGCPPAGGDEVVETIRYQDDGVYFVTDAAVYAYPPTASPVVEAGDAVRAGDFFSSAIQVFEAGECKDAPLSAIEFSRAELAPGTVISSGVVFPNVQVPVTYQMNDGVITTSWQLGGTSADVQAFWARANAQPNGQRPADILIRLYGQLPETINPARFLFETLFSTNTLVLVVDAAQVDTQRLKNNAPVLRKFLPPQTVVLGTIGMDGDGDEASVASTDSFGSFMMGGESEPGDIWSVDSFAGDPIKEIG
jgi:hypothetical protein